MRLLAVALLVVGCAADRPTPAADCVDEWNTYVEEWNALTVERDEAGADFVVFNGIAYDSYEEWAADQGYPLTYQELCPE